MAIFKELTSNDIKTSKSSLNQVIDVIQNDISGSSTRRTYQVFVTGGIGPGVTSSMVHTVYDQDFTLQTANPIFDMTVGLFASGSTVVTSSSGIDTNGKLLFPSTSLMMREKVGIYEQFAQALLGANSAQFTAPLNSTVASDAIEDALFISFKRLFTRDQIARETFALKMYQSAAWSEAGQPGNLDITSESGSVIITDVGSSTNQEITQGGQVGNLVNSADSNVTFGNIFYDHGIVVLDIDKVFSGSQHISGVIDAMNSNSIENSQTGVTWIGDARSENPEATLVPDLMVSASIDNIIDHIAGTRFSSGSLTAAVFQNVTNINSTLIFCRATADEFNYSSNPTYLDDDNRIVVIDQGQENTQQAFSFISSVALMDANDNILAVAKLSRPVEKNPEKDLTIRVRLDY